MGLTRRAQISAACLKGRETAALNLPRRTERYTPTCAPPSDLASMRHWRQLYRVPMLSCPLHQDVVLQDTPAGPPCFVCGDVVEPLEVPEPETKVLGFRRPEPPRHEPAPRREGTYDEPISDGGLEGRIQALRDALQLAPNDPRIIVALAEALAKNGQRVEAAALFFQRARFFIDDGFALQAIAHLKHALRLDPSQHGARRLLAHAYEAQGLREQALLELEKLWLQHRRDGQLSASYKVVSELLRIQPDFAPLHPAHVPTWARCTPVAPILAGKAVDATQLKSIGRLDAFVRDLENLLSLGPVAPMNLEGWAEMCLHGVGRKAVSARLEQALSDSPDSPPLMLMLAQALEETPRAADAAELYSRVIPRCPDAAWADELRARVRQLSR